MALAVLAVGALVVGRSPLFAITHVRIDGVSGDLADDVRDAAQVRVGQNLFDARLAEARDRVQSLPWVADVVIDQVPPSAVVISVEERLAAAVVRTAGASWLVGAGGRVIAGGERAETPVIEVPGTTMPPLGEPVDDAGVRAGLAVIAQLPDNIGERVMRYEPMGDQVTAVLDTGDVLPSQDQLMVRFGSPRDMERKAEVLPVMLDAIVERQAEQASPEKVLLDVRAPEHPVLRPG